MRFLHGSNFKVKFSFDIEFEVDCTFVLSKGRVISKGIVNLVSSSKIIKWQFLNFLLYIPYSREQKHVSISDTPMLLIEINSISNMGRQK